MSEHKSQDNGSSEERTPKNFLEEIIEKDLKEGRQESVLTRFPPEPNGYLHIGHAKSISVNFGLADQYGGETNLRFDDTNPVTETVEYVENIKHDVRWLGYEWARELYASDYFEDLFGFAITLIRKGLAYVDDSTSEEIAAAKGTPTRSGTNSPYRDRSPEENEDLFRRMRDGEFPEGTRTLRAKIDMASPNMLMRDPVIYRIKHAPHHRTGDKWCIYPTYDMAHGQSDAIEKITHSICTLEFMPHRELYDWFIEKLELFPSRQYEFARLNMSYTIMSKRRLLRLVEENYVDGWDDPRMPTISGLRRRGYTPEAIRDFCTRIGVAKRNNLIDVSLLEFCAREHLNKISHRRMVVFDPIKLVITNWPEGQVEQLVSENNPEDDAAGNRMIPFSGELYIERGDFMEDPPRKFFRLGPGRSVRLKSAFIVTCDDFVKDEDGNVTEVHCRYHPDSRSGSDTSGIKAKGTLHWVSIPHAHKIEVREYDRLFDAENPVDEAAKAAKAEESGKAKEAGKAENAGKAKNSGKAAGETQAENLSNPGAAGSSQDETSPEDASKSAQSSQKQHDFTDYINKNSLNIISEAYAEPAMADEPSVAQNGPKEYYQFMRKGYYVPDKYSTKEKQIFNRTVTLRDTWAKKQKKK